MRISRSVTRLTAVLAASAVASIGLTACSNNDKAEPDKSSDSASQSETKSKEEKVELEYWHRLPDKPEMIKVSESADEWNKDNPNIQVKAVKFEGDATASYEKITAAVKAGNAPCLAQASYDGIPAMLVRGELMDVTEQASQYQDKYAAGPWGQASPGGKTYGLPQDTGPLVYYYDKAAFEKLGLKAPTNWDEYWANAEKAKAAGKYSSVFLKDEAGDWFGAVAAANGAEWFSVDGDAWKVAVDGDKTQPVAAAWQKSIDAGATLVTDRWGDPSPFDNAIKSGQVIGYIGAGWEAAFNLGALGKDSADWQVAQVPGDMTGPWGGSAIVVLKGCKYPEQALKFANWYNTNMKAMTSQGLVPAAKGDAPTPDGVKKLYGGQNVMAELAKAADRANAKWVYSPTWPAVKKLLIDNANAKKPLSDNLKAAQAEAVKTLEAQGLKVAK